MPIKVYTRSAIISAKQLEAVDKVICFMMDNKIVWEQTPADIRKLVDKLDTFVQEQW